MPTYKYKGIEKNKNMKGIITANTENDAFRRLKESGIYATEFDKVLERKYKLYKLKSLELSDFCRQIGTMQMSGVPIVKSIDILAERTLNLKIKKVYKHILSSLDNGYTLSEAMKQTEGSFPELLINMFEAGESSGQLDSSAIKMAEYYVGDHKLNSKLKKAMIYPSILAVITVTMIIVLFTFVLPIFIDMYEKSGTKLNILTQILFNFSNFVIANWFLCIVVAVASFIIIKLILKIEIVKFNIDKKKIRLPKIGHLMIVVYTARFARTLSSLYSSGVSMLEAVEASAKIIQNKFIIKEFNRVTEGIKAGNSLSTSIEGVEGIEPKLIATIFIGEESGRLDTMLDITAADYEFESDSAIDNLLSLLEPVMILVMAVIIAPILIAVLLPMFNMYKMIG